MLFGTHSSTLFTLQVKEVHTKKVYFPAARILASERQCLCSFSKSAEQDLMRVLGPQTSVVESLAVSTSPHTISSLLVPPPIWLLCASRVVCTQSYFNWYLPPLPFDPRRALLIQLPNRTLLSLFKVHWPLAMSQCALSVKPPPDFPGCSVQHSKAG